MQMAGLPSGIDCVCIYIWMYDIFIYIYIYIYILHVYIYIYILCKYTHGRTYSCTRVTSFRRDLEASLLRDFLKTEKEGKVLVCGGGIVETQACRDCLKAAAKEV
jgi:hypothetical protein